MFNFNGNIVARSSLNINSKNAPEKRMSENLKRDGQFCNVGYNVGLIKPNGDISYCIAINKSLGNIYEEIKFNDKLIRCPSKFCYCPVNMYDLPLFRKAISEVGPYDAEWIQPFKNRIKDFTKNLLYKYLTDNTRKLIIEIFMRNKFTRKYLLKHWI